MHRSRREVKPLSARGSFRRALWVVLIGLGSMMLVDRATRSGRSVRAPEPVRLDRLSAGSLSEHLALAGPAEAALAAERELAKLAPPKPQATPPVPGVVAVREVRCDGPRSSPEGAKVAAAELAAALLSKQLAQLDSPVDAAVTPADVLGRYLKKVEVVPASPEDRAAFEQVNNMQADWSVATVSAEITPEQIRKLRAAPRTLGGMKIAAALAAALGALVAFLALDALTKGYLSWGLGLGLGGAALGTATGLYYLT